MADLKPYFDALATGDPNQMAAAVDLAASGSNAYAHAVYLAAFTQAQRDAGWPSEANAVTLRSLHTV